MPRRRGDGSVGNGGSLDNGGSLGNGDSAGGFDAIVLAGGRASRLGGIDKTAEPVGGRSLLARVVDAVAAADRVIVCGGRAHVLPAGVLSVAEAPPGGGPAHGAAAAIASVTRDRVVLLAGDLPFLTPAAVRQLLDGLSAPHTDVAVAVDDQHREQFLLAAWDAAALRSAIDESGDCYGLPLRKLYRQVRVRPQALRGTPPPWWDCDTADQLATARTWSEESPTDDAR